MITVEVTELYTIIKTQQMLYLKLVNFTVCELHFNHVDFFKQFSEKKQKLPVTLVT